jgi:putative sterol carrier protein
VSAEGTNLSVVAGAPDRADLVVTTSDDTLHRLLTRQLSPAKAVASGAVTLTGRASALSRLIDLFVFPTLG